MNRHARFEQSESEQLIVPIVHGAFSRSAVTLAGLPRLMIDYGGSALVLDTVDPVHAETFALGLARCSLTFASHCRYLIADTRN